MNIRLARAVRVALISTGSVAAITLGAGALAQGGQPAVEEVTVTGTRVRGIEPVGTAVQVIDRKQMEDAGQVSIDRMIKDLPQNFDLGVSENSRSTGGGSGNVIYGNTVNLRGIGPYATLIMIDGHRAINNSRSLDPSIMPTLGVERVEVIADGSSAIYGSDAIAGVVNIIPRRSLDGAEVFARYGSTSGSDFNESLIGAAFGKKWADGQAMFAYEHADRDNLSGDDRDYFRSDQSVRGGGDYRVTRCSPGTLRIGTTTYALPASALSASNVAALVAGSTNKCNDLIGQDLFPKQKYDSANFTGSYNFNDTVSFFTDGFYSKRTFERLPAYAAATLTVPATNAFFVKPAGFTGTSYQIDYNYLNDIPRDLNTGYARNWEISPGLRVALPKGWEFEGVYTYGRNHDESNTYRGLNSTAVSAALASSDPATALDPFGGGRTSQSVRDLISNQIFLAPTLNTFKGYELRANGSLMQLPGGDLAAAVGYENQDQDVSLGSARGNPGTALTWRDFNRQVDSGYAELLVPIIGKNNASSGLRSLAFTAAVRYDDYSDVGDTTNNKYGLTWKPTDTVKVRASFGTSFRAPLISQIYGNSNALFGQSYQNPAGGAPLTGFALSGPNLNLGPEEATTWTFGADWEITPNLSVGLTHFDIEYRNQVETYLSNLAILSRESEFAGTGIILRGTEAANRVVALVAQGITLARGAYPGGNPANVTLFVDGRNNNLGTSRTKGIDFQVDYQLDTANYGNFRFNLNGTWLSSYALSITATAPLINRLDTIFNPLKFKARGSVSWDKGDFHSQLALTHISGYTNNAVTPQQAVSDYNPLDLRVAYTLGKNGSATLLKDLTLGVEIRNLFDEKPPYVNLAPSGNGGGGYDATEANPVGRLYAVSLRKSW